jgi:hypothetical protein
VRSPRPSERGSIYVFLASDLAVRRKARRCVYSLLLTSLLDVKQDESLLLTSLLDIKQDESLLLTSLLDVKQDVVCIPCF